MHSKPDELFIKLAIDQARNAEVIGEVPVGAVIVRDGVVIATGFNQVITQSDPTAHAEIVALREAATKLGNYRLPGCELYVTLEPCAMCMGAMLHARLSRVVFGAADPKTGVCGGVIDLPAVKQLNHQTEVRGGVLADDCGNLLRSFFLARRAKKNGALLTATPAAPQLDLLTHGGAGCHQSHSAGPLPRESGSAPLFAGEPQHVPADEQPYPLPRED